MKIEKINRLIGAKFGTPDNIIGKHLLFKKFPEVKTKLVYQNSTRYTLPLEEAAKYGIAKEGATSLIFDIKDFPELFEEK